LLHAFNRVEPERLGGGRAVKGGSAFAFQLDKEGKPSQPFGAYKRLDNGGRIVVLGRRHGVSVPG
jgi:hypothetical protein